MGGLMAWIPLYLVHCRQVRYPGKSTTLSHAKSIFPPGNSISIYFHSVIFRTISQEAKYLRDLDLIASVRVVFCPRRLLNTNLTRISPFLVLREATATRLSAHHRFT